MFFLILLMCIHIKSIKIFYFRWDEISGAQFEVIVCTILLCLKFNSYRLFCNLLMSLSDVMPVVTLVSPAKNLAMLSETLQSMKIKLRYSCRVGFNYFNNN